MFTITIEAETTKELTAKLQQLAFGFAPLVTKVEEVAAVKPKKESKATEKPVEVETEVKTIPVAKAEAVQETSEFMKVKNQCLEVAKIKGRTALENLLNEFSVKRITELTADQYPSVLKAVEEVLAD